MSTPSHCRRSPHTSLLALLVAACPFLALAHVATNAAAAEPAVVLRATKAQHRLEVTVGDGVVKAEACRPGGQCSGESYPIPKDALIGKATAEPVWLSDDRGVALVRIPQKGGGSWVLVLATSSAKGSPAVESPLTGTLDVARGGVEGEQFRRVLALEKLQNGTRLVIGKQYDNATVCGRPATLSAQELDPADLSWRPTHARSLSLDAQLAATEVTAAASSDAFDTNAPRLLHATVASSALGQSRSGMTDGDLATRWAEKRPGSGRGELISMNGSEEVPMTGFELVFRPTGDAPKGAAPKSFYIATDAELFHVTVAEDAFTAEPGRLYRVALPKPVTSDCVAVVLDDAFVAGERDEVSITELRAQTALDGKGPAELTELLRGDSPEADAAKALLARGGPAAVAAVMAAYPSLDRRGQARAIEVLESGGCSATAGFYVDRLLGRGVELQAFEPELDPVAKRARTQLRGCRDAATTALAAALTTEPPGKRRVIAARELADINPAPALAAILAVLEDGSTAPKASGASDEVRRGLRRALAVAARHPRAERAVRELLAPEPFAKLPLVVRIDLLRALGSDIVKLEPEASAALDGLLKPEASFRTRYLLMPPAAQLARAGSVGALALLRSTLEASKSAHLRARAAAVSGGIPALDAAMVAALGDASPRVREAALGGLTAAAKMPSAAEGRVVKLLAEDKWTFVRMAAAQALVQRPAGGAVDRALLAALEDPNNQVREAVLRALGERKTHAAGDLVHDIADDAKEPIGVRSTAIATLGALCRADSTELLYKLALRAGYQQLPYDQPLGLAALAALGELKPPDLATRLAPLLTRGGPVPPLIRSITRDVLTKSGSCRSD